MSIFVGNIGTKSVLSLNKAAGTGNQPANHNVPDANTIFHSDMPHLFIKQRYSVPLAAGGDGYFVGTLPAALSTLLSNRANVIIPLVVCRNSGGTEFYHQMVGIGKSQAYAWSTTYGGIGVSGMYGGSISFDLNLEWGYYIAGTGTVADTIGVNGTGGYTIHNVECGEDFEAYTAYQLATGGILANKTWPATNRNPSRNFTPRSNPPYNNVNSVELYNLKNPDYMAPLGPSGTTYNRVYVRAGGARNFTGRANFGAGTAATRVRSIDFYKSDPITDASTSVNDFRTTGLERHLRNGLISGITEATYAGMTPVRFEFLVLNATFSNTGGYTAENLFANGEIKISNVDFTINGVNLRNTNYEMMAAVSTGTPSISNSYFCTNTQAAAATTLPDGGAFRLFGTTAAGAGGSWAASNVDGSIGAATQWNIGCYKFPVNSSIQIDSRDPSISINSVDVWSPTVRPLQLFAANKASNIIIGDNEYLRPIATGGTLMLSSVNVGLAAAGTTAILMSLEWMSNDLCGPAGDPSMEWLWNYRQPANWSSAGVGARLTKMDYDRGDGVSHQILVLNPNVYVPIMVTNAFSFSGAADPSGGRPKSRFQYYIRKNGTSGNIEFWACSRATALTTPNGSVPNAPYVQFPKLRINVQRLT